MSKIFKLFQSSRFFLVFLKKRSFSIFNSIPILMHPGYFLDGGSSSLSSHSPRPRPPASRNFFQRDNTTTSTSTSTTNNNNNRFIMGRRRGGGRRSGRTTVIGVKPRYRSAEVECSIVLAEGSSLQRRRHQYERPMTTMPSTSCFDYQHFSISKTKKKKTSSSLKPRRRRRIIGRMTPQDVGGEDLEEMEVMEQLKNDGESEVDGDVVESAFSALRRIKTSCSSRYCFSLFFLSLFGKISLFDFTRT